MTTTLAERLKEARAHARLSQPELEAKSGVSQKTISKIERGDQKSTTKIVQLASACGVRPEWLGTGEGPMVDLTPGLQQERSGYGHMLSTEALEVARMWQELLPERREHHRQTIMVESVIGEAVGDRLLTPRPHEWRRDYQKRLTRALRNVRKGDK